MKKADFTHWALFLCTYSYSALALSNHGSPPLTNEINEDFAVRKAITSNPTASPVQHSASPTGNTNTENSPGTSSPTSSSSPTASPVQHSASPAGNTNTENSPVTSSPTSSSSPTVSLVQHTVLPTDNTDYSSVTLSPTYSSVMPQGYYNYSPYSKWGPKHWGEIDVEGNEYFNWLTDYKNECDGNRQSPINVKAGRGASCLDDHQTYTKRGTSKASFDTIDFKILPNSLRANLAVSETNKREDIIGPKMDTSNLANWKAATFVELKLPSEHHFKGKQYAGEFQIFHYWDTNNGRMITLSVMMDDTDDEENIMLEQFLREWEEVAWKKENECARKLGIDVPAYNRTYARPSKEEMGAIWGDKCGKRKCNYDEHADYDLYRLIPTFWYCSYLGSLTAPPCTESIFWRIYDLPMKMSKDQHARLKRVLLQQLDDDCNRASIAYNRGVNRPLQKNRARNKATCCKGNNFKAEVDNKSYWRDQWPRKYHGRNALVGK